MKQAILLLVMGVSFLFSHAQTVIISKYVEACSGSTPKVIELWNPTGVDINMASTPITVWKGVNGAATSVDVTINTGTLKAGETLVVGTDDATGTTCHTYVSESFTFNGDDALEVKLDGVITDIFGEVGLDPGSSWSGSGVSTANSAIELKSGITTGRTTNGTFDPSSRFQVLSASCSMTGFGIPPGGCPVATPTLTASPNTVTRLNYPLSNGGPSPAQAVTLTGSLMGTDLATVTAPSDFEIATTSGGTYGSSLNFTPSSASINSTFYVRLKSGKGLGAYSANMTVAHDSITTFNVPLSGSVTSGNDTIRVVSYNLLQYSNSATAARNASLRSVLSDMDPDLVGVCEIQSGETGFNNARDSLFELALPHFKPGTFIQSTNDMSTAIFYDSTKFSFVSNTPIVTALRDINEYTLIHLFSLDTFRVFEVHLKASDGSSDRTKRAAEVHLLRQRTEALPSGSNFVIQGDFNIYDSDEAAYDTLTITKGSAQGHGVDPITMPNTSNWNNSSNAQYHSQSTRTRSFGGGATSGLDDRFDFILHSAALGTASDVFFLSNSYSVFGNDGNHYDDSINDPTNSAVSAAIADALHDGSDHLPVLAQFVFVDGGTTLPVHFTSFEGKRDASGEVTLTWQTAMENNNKGFEVQRLVDNKGWKNIGFVEGVGFSEQLTDYQFIDPDLEKNTMGFYRLKQIDFDGPYKYSSIVKIDLQVDFANFRVYPNPFNDRINIRFDEEMNEDVQIGLYDLSGRLIQGETIYNAATNYTLSTEFIPAGIYLLSVQSSTTNEVIRVVKK